MKLQRQIDQLLAQRASEWHQILENATDAQRAEFVTWLKQSPLHVQEYLETVYTDKLLGHVDDERLEDVNTLIAQVAPSVVSSEKKSHPPLPSARGMKKRLWWWAAAAAALVLCVAALPFVFNHMGAKPEYATALGEQRTIQLPDSSVVTLNADSRIQLQLDRTHRDVLLRGEALFKVAHDPHRPFIVQTKTAVVQALGSRRCQPAGARTAGRAPAR